MSKYRVSVDGEFEDEIFDTKKQLKIMQTI